MRCAGMTVGLAVTLAFFGLTDLAVCQSMAKKKPVNLLRLPSARVELAPAADKDALPALTDEDPATIAVFKAAKNAPVDIVYGFEGATVTPEMEEEYAKMKGELKKRAMEVTPIGFIAPGMVSSTRDRKA